MELFELTQLIESIDSKIFTRWQYFIVVVLAMVGWLVTKPENLDIRMAGILIAGLMVFFVGNGVGINKSVETLVLIEAERKAALIEYEKSNTNIDAQKNEFKIYTSAFRDYLQNDSAAFKDNWKYVYVLICFLTIVLVIYKVYRI